MITIKTKIYADGLKCWYQNGERHRDNDQPAIINADGSRYWFQNGNLIKEE